MPRILVPLDESPLAEEALPWAGALSKALGLTIHLVSVWNYDGELYRRAGLEMEATPRRIADYLEGYLARLAAREARAGLDVSTEVRIGDIDDELEDVAAEGNTALVVMTSHGRGGVKRLIQGSVADHIVRTLNIPVLVVRPGEAAPPIERVLVTVDGSDTSSLALEPARRIAAGCGAEVHLLQVVNPASEAMLPAPLGPDIGQLTEQLSDAALETVNSLKRPGEVADVRYGRPVDGILDYAREKDCDVIVMATRGRGGILRFALGSTADAVVRAADRPVLLVPDRSGT